MQKLPDPNVLSGNFIEKGQLRIGIAYLDNKTQKIFHKWYLWEEFKTRPLLVSDLADTDYLLGIEKLKEEDIEDILQFVPDDFSEQVRAAISSLPPEELYVPIPPSSNKD